MKQNIFKEPPSIPPKAPGSAIVTGEFFHTWKKVKSVGISSGPQHSKGKFQILIMMPVGLWCQSLSEIKL